MMTSAASIGQNSTTEGSLEPSSSTKSDTDTSTSTASAATTADGMSPPISSPATTGQASGESTATSTATQQSPINSEQTTSTMQTTETTEASESDCAGVEGGTAYVNKCGFCVKGTTGIDYTYGLDDCNVCNGTNACVGCDGIAWSGLKRDQCGRCLAESNANFDKPCDIALNGIFPLLLDSQASKHILSLAVANPSEVSEFTVRNCWLQDSLSTKYNGAAVKENETAIRLSIDQVLQNGMELSVHCIMNNKEYNFPENVLVTNFEQAVKQSGASPSIVSLGSDLSSILVSFDQKLASKYFTAAPYCLLVNGTALPALRSGDDTSYVTCDLSSIASNGTIQLRAVRGQEMHDATINFQVPLDILIQDKRPVLTSAHFSDDLTSLLLNFDENVQVVGDECMRIFSSETRRMLGALPSCSIRGATIVLTFGQNATLAPSNRIDIDLTLVERFTRNSPPSSYPSTITAETQIPGNSSASLVPQTTFVSTPSPTYFTTEIKMPSIVMTPKLHIDAPQKLTLCQQHITIDVRRVFGDGGRPLAYTWTISSLKSVSSALSSLVSSMHGRSLTIPRSMLENSTEYEITVKACNFIAQCSETLTMPVSVSLDATSFDVRIRGLTSPVVPSKRLNAVADPTFEKCGQTHLLPPSDVTYSWLVDNVRVDSGSTLRIPAFQFVVGQTVVVRVEAQYTDSETNMTYTAAAVSQLRVSAEPLIAAADGMTRSINEAYDLVIDYSPSSD
uniref:Uncharacterized protein n=1 Tax=Plectus sambesii TaxID=2011161 RepID=A0A914XKK1_9BILA